MTFRSLHHRKPTSIGGDDSARNTQLVNYKQHQAWHILFANKTAPEIIDLINRYWIDPDFFIECIDKKELGGIPL